MRSITFCRICSIEINKTLFSEHINSKKHKEIEGYLNVMGMTYFEQCSKEKRIDEWRKHITSEEHLQIEDKIYCDICMNKYSFRGYMGTIKEKCRDAERIYRSYLPRATNGDEITRKKNQERLKFYCS